MSIPDFAIRRSVTIYIACAIVILLGAISFQRLPIDLMPDIEFPRITVMTRYEGVAPGEMETLITRRVEETLGGAPGVQEVSSSSTEGQSRVMVSFDWGTDLDEAADELRTRLDRLRRSLPEGSEPPTMFKFDLSQFPIMFLGVAGDMGPRELRRLTEEQIQYRIERVPGVAQAEVRGGLRREIHVNLALEKLQSLDLSVNEVVNLIRRENTNLPGGPVEEGRYELLLRTQGEFQSLAQIQNLVLTTRRGVPVYLRDVAEIEDAWEDERQIIRINDQQAVRMTVQKQSGANTAAVARGVRAEIERINRDFPRIEVWPLMDSSTFIERSIRSVGEHALEGALLAVLILLFFLRNLRSTLIVSLAIPVSMVATCALLYFSGFTLNVMTLGGLALGVGRLVDDAIVVLENTFRHREAGKSREEAARVGSSEVSNAIMAATLTTIVVFVPVAFLSGIADVLFSQLALTVAFALFCSLLVALSLIPMLCSKYLRVELPSEQQHPLLYRVSRGIGSFLDQIDLRYQKAVGWALFHRKTVVAGGAAAFAMTLLLVPFIGVELMPQTDEGEVQITVELPPGTRLEMTDEVTRRVEAVLQEEVPETENVMVQVGSGGGGGGYGNSGAHRGQITLRLGERASRDRSTQEIAATLNRRLGNFEPGVQVRTRASGGMHFTRMLSGGQGQERASVEIRGYNLQYATELANEVKDLVEAVPGVTDARISREDGLPEMLIQVDRIKAAMLGLNVNELGGVLETAVGGQQAGMYREEGDEYNILVRLREADRSSLDNVGHIPVATPAGNTVPVGGLISMQRQEGPVAIQRQDRERIITVSANFDGRDLGSVMSDIQTRLEPLRAQLPQDFAILYGGEFEEQQESFQQLLFGLILAVLLVYMVMAAQYESWRDPFIILFSIPLAAVGVALMLFLTGTTFSIQAFLGVIMLAGIVVSNAILLVDYANLMRRREGLSVFEAVTLAGRRRLRPILMTTLTTVLGLTPMALGFGEGGEVQAPMARVVIGGLLTSTLITLLFVPTLYAIAEDRTEKRKVASTPQPDPLPAGGGD